MRTKQESILKTSGECRLRRLLTVIWFRPWSRPSSGTTPSPRPWWMPSSGSISAMWNQDRCWKWWRVVCRIWWPILCLRRAFTGRKCCTLPPPPLPSSLIYSITEESGPRRSHPHLPICSNGRDSITRWLTQVWCFLVNSVAGESDFSLAGSNHARRWAALFVPHERIKCRLFIRRPPSFQDDDSTLVQLCSIWVNFVRFNS